MLPPPHEQKVLIVDDDEGLLLLMAESLQSEGYAISTASSGRAALAWVEENSADLMLLDLKMRDLDGPTLLAKMQEGEKRIPFIVVTGQGDEKLAVEVMKRGALDYVMKDTAMLDLLPAVVRRTLVALAQTRALADAQREHQRLEQEVLAAAERERQSIGADLHDGVGQLLTAVGLMCTVLKEETARNQPEVSRNLEKMSAMLRDAVAQTRYLARGLVPVGDEPDALQTGLAELAARTHGLGRVRCRLDCDSAVQLTDPAKAGHLYRIAQEAVNNALKHARAGNIEIHLTQDDTHIRLEVRDDGIGLPATRSVGVGLGLMRHRASVIGASLEIISRTPGGVTVSCAMPRST